MPGWPGLEVVLDARQLARVPVGSTVVLVARAEDASWLNRQRPLLATRSLRVVLWSDAATTGVLAREAPDFFDWISVRVACPPGPALHGIASLAAAVGAPGVAWQGGPLRACLEAAFPGARVLQGDATGTFDEVIEAARAAGPEDWLIWRGVSSLPRLRRVRWALALAGHRSRNVLVEPGLPSPGWWTVDGRTVPIGVAAARLEERGLPRAALLAGLLGLEGAALDMLDKLASAAPRGPDLALLAGQADGGAAFGALLLEEGRLSTPELPLGSGPVPALRALAAGEELMRCTTRILEQTSRQVHAGERVEDERLGWWAAHVRDAVRPGAPHPELDRAWLVEAVLAAAPDSPTTRRWAAEQVDLLGDRAVAAWLGDQVRGAEPKGGGYDLERPCFSVPFPAKDDGVVGREAALEQVRQQLVEGRRTVVGQAAAFVGLGGIGKTQLAVEYCWRWRDAYPGGVYWLHADQDLDIQLLQLSDRARWLHPSTDHATKLEVARHRLRRSRGALLVLDNVLRGDDLVEVLPYPDADVHLLLTSREPQAGFAQVDLDLLDPARSLQMLKLESGRDLAAEGDRQAALRVADQLEGLPLALELAGAYLRRLPLSWAEYADRLEAEGVQTRGLRPPGFAQESLTRHEANLLATLRIDEPLLEARPGLRDALDVLAWSGPASMGWSLLQALVVPDDPDALLRSLREAVGLRVLGEEADPRGPRFRMHRLVQQVRQAQVPVRAHATRARLVLPRLGDWFEARRMDFDDLPAFEAEADHLEAWARHAASLEVPREQVRLGWLGAYPHYHRGRFADALSVVRSVQHLLAAIKDAEPRLVVCVYSDEATLLTELARPEEALGIVDRALAFGEAALGTEHREVILLLGVKSVALGAIGNATAAIDCARDMLLRSQRARDDDGDLIPGANNKLGIAYARAGRNREACSHAERSLGLCLAEFGERHPNTANEMGNLGYYLVRVDRIDEGLELLRRSLALLREILGEEHPTVAATYGKLAVGLLHAGQRSAATAALREEWSLGRRVLPTGNADTLRAATDLARSLHSLHRTDEARAVIDQTLAELPGDHPERPRLEALRQAPRPTAEPTRPSGKTSKAARKAQAAARKRNRPQKKRR